MSWVNLDDVYVNKSGDTIAGDLSVNGALKVNDGKGTNTTYNVANEITTLRDSVSQSKQRVLIWNGKAGKGTSITLNGTYKFTDFKSFYCLTSADKTIGLPLVQNRGINENQHLHGITGWDDGTSSWILVGLIALNSSNQATVICMSKHVISGANDTEGKLLKLWGYY